MATRSVLSSVKNSAILLLIFFAVLMVAGCKLTPLKIDPCAVWPDDISNCYAVPLNQAGKLPYDRKINPGDICVTSDEYAKIQKSYREILKRCGDRCK
jgi:hypothetical protein